MRLPLLPSRPWLGAHRVHIRPSRAGLAFAVLVLALWIAAVNYHLGLGHALSCFAAACALADMLFSSRNLAGLALAATPGEPVAAGGTAQFELRLINRSARPRHAIALASGSPANVQWADVDAHGAAAITLAITAGQRGWLAAPGVRLSSNFPLGLFHAWCHWQPEAGVLVYPCPESPAPPLPFAVTPRAHPQQELAGVRAYRPGDPLHRLAWRQIARHDGEHLVSKQFTAAGDEPGQHSLLFDYASLPQAGTEARLSRLCAWVLEAERLHLPYRLRLPGLDIGAGLGPSQRLACLRALALHGLPQEGA